MVAYAGRGVGGVLDVESAQRNQVRFHCHPRCYSSLLGAKVPGALPETLAQDFLYVLTLLNGA